MVSRATGKEYNMIVDVDAGIDGATGVTPLTPTGLSENCGSALEAIEELVGVLPHLGLEPAELTGFQETLGRMAGAVIRARITNSPR